MTPCPSANGALHKICNTDPAWCACAGRPSRAPRLPPPSKTTALWYNRLSRSAHSSFPPATPQKDPRSPRSRRPDGTAVAAIRPPAGCTMMSSSFSLRDAIVAVPPDQRALREDIADRYHQFVVRRMGGGFWRCLDDDSLARPYHASLRRPGNRQRFAPLQTTQKTGETGLIKRGNSTCLSRGRQPGRGDPDSGPMAGYRFSTQIIFRIYRWNYYMTKLSRYGSNKAHRHRKWRR
jgi:hypothetical protein